MPRQYDTGHVGPFYSTMSLEVTIDDLCPAAPGTNVSIRIEAFADLGCSQFDQDRNPTSGCPDCNLSNIECCDVHPNDKYVSVYLNDLKMVPELLNDEDSDIPGTGDYFNGISQDDPVWLPPPDTGNFFSIYSDNDPLAPPEYGRSHCSGETGGVANMHQFFISAELWNDRLAVAGDSMTILLLPNNVKSMDVYCNSLCEEAPSSSARVLFAYTPLGSCCDGNECSTTGQADCEGTWILGGECNARMRRSPWMTCGCSCACCSLATWTARATA